MFRKNLVLFSSTILLALQLTAKDNLVIRYPSINNDGSKIAFSYQGDIWTVPSTGGEAKRITIHEAYDAWPVWSPEGDAIAFSSNRFGNFDVFTIPSDGGFPKRLTYHSADDNISDWAANGSIFFDTNREFNQIEWNSEVYSVSENGGTPNRFLDAMGEESVLSPDGKFLAFVLGPCRLTREEYNGSANRDIWIYNTTTKEFSKITEWQGHDIYPHWSDSRTLYYISSKTDDYNVHKMTLDDNAKVLGDEQITDFKDGGVRYFDVSADGKKVILEKGANIYLVDTSTKEVKEVDVKIGADYRFDPTERKTLTKDITEYAVSPNGKYSAFVIRGEVFVSENDKEKSKTINLSNSPYRDQQVQWLSDTTVIFTSDRNGQFDLYLVKSSNPKETNIFKSLKHEITRLTETKEEEAWPIISPDKKKIAYEIGTGKLVVADIDAEGDLSNEVVLLDGWDAPGNISWSPDSKWLAYSLEDLTFNEEIYIHSADGKTGPVNVSYHPRGDTRPVWSADGSKLGFLSDRNNSTTDVWFVWLNKKDWQKTKDDWEEADEEKTNDKKKDDKDKKDEVKPIVIDFENIYERITQVTNLSTDEGMFEISKDGKTFYFTAKSNTAKENDLYSINWDGTEIKELTSGGISPSALQFDSEYKYIYMLSKGLLKRFDVSKSKDESLPIAAKMIIDYKAEKEQMFDEAWRYLNEGFYDPDFHGKDWKALKEKYRPWAIKASTPRDFRDIFNYMLGEINASHMGMYGRGNDRTETQEEKTGMLGVELKAGKDGMEILRVIPDTPADREESKLNRGEMIIGVNGTMYNPEINFYSLLTATANERTLLIIKDLSGNEREVVIRPAASIKTQLYDEWVKERRKLTDEYSNGKLGYLHIEAMGWESFERFERELAAVGHGKDGIVIDVRYNGGGWTTDYLMAILNVKQHAYTVPRGATDNLEKEHSKFRDYYPYAERLPYFPWMKPSIALCNESSYSNAEIFSHAYKTLGIGTLVGTPTFGAVISTGGTSLIDGTWIRLPFRAWYVKATEETMENKAAVPDVIIDNAPDSKAKGMDEQLKKSVEILMDQLSKK